MYSKKLFGINTFSCIEGSMGLRPEWPWKARRKRISCPDEPVQYWNLFLWPPPPTIVLFHISSDQCWECTKSFRRWSLNLQNSIAPSSSQGRWSWRRKSAQSFWHWVSDMRTSPWIYIGPSSFHDGYSSCGWASRSTSSWFCFSLWSARKSKNIRLQRKFFELHLRGFLLVVVVLFVDQVCDQLVQSMRNSCPRERIVFVLHIQFHFPLRIYLAGSWLWLPIRAQLWCSLESNLSGQMIFHLLAKCSNDKLVNFENSSVSFVMKYCPTSTVVRNPASVQNLITRLLWKPFNSFLVCLQ